MGAINIDKIKGFFTKEKMKEFFTKENMKRIFTHPIALSIYAAIVLIFILVKLTILWLSFYTNHGQEVTVPDLSGKSLSEAQTMLENQGLTCEVVDSMYKPTVAPGAIVDQVPQPNSKVKEGRKIYLYVRASHARQIALPNLQDITSRQAQAMLESAGLRVNKIEYVQSEHKDLVVSVVLNGKIIAYGTKLEEGTAVDLHVGKGTSSEMMPMISLRGMNEDHANDALKDQYVSITNAIYDVKPANDADKAYYMVYKQSPITGTMLTGNERVIIYLTKDKSKLSEPEEVAKSNEGEDNDTDE